MIEEWTKKDPIDRFERILTADRVLTGQVKEGIDEKIHAVIDDAVDFALASPSPPAGEVAEGVYAP
jgi:TPP-dependent pyruvate/acetoin dehydrogenase alpha subunit